MTSPKLEEANLQMIEDKLAKTLDQWVAYDKNLYHFSKDLATWDEAVEECVTKESGLVFVKWGEEQSFIDETAIKIKKDFWIGLKKNTSAHNDVIWIGGHRAGTTNGLRKDFTSLPWWQVLGFSSK
ncbi:hypothetical protein JRQ81_015470 [Phrynocephalus forsythii]|uniref:C-type lectin domain-containing protein n=1 Tax=Phrynocephalus forsythii TaxID=171643 RepID=A0A9Q0XXB0_9SAUR|nr:hypothetical protein JRQ81_015470 [Phrynocephalus forsythii]